MVNGLEDIIKINKVPRERSTTGTSPASDSNLNWRTGNPKAHKAGMKGKPPPTRSRKRSAVRIGSQKKKKRS